MDFGPFGAAEILFICALALVVFGPRRLGELGASAGRTLTRLRRAAHDLRRSYEEEVGVVAEAGRQVTEAAAPLRAAPGAVRREMGLASETLREIGREIEGSPPRARSPGAEIGPAPADVPPGVGRDGR